MAPPIPALHAWPWGSQAPSLRPLTPSPSPPSPSSVSQGCNRSFAELWRLKVHYRAPPDVRGSGKERGHGTELKFCPKCGKELKPGKHHVGCSAGKSAPRQAAKRQRQMSSTTESDWVSQTSTASLEQDNSDSWEDTVRRQVTKVQRQKSLDDTAGARAGGSRRGGAAAAASGPAPRGGAGAGGSGGAGRAAAAQAAAAHEASCRIQRMQQMLTEGDHNAELVFTANTMADFGLILRTGGARGGDVPGGGPAAPGDGGSLSPSPSLEQLLAEEAAAQAGDLAALPILRVPSPPPLPVDWDFGPSGGPGHASLLFDFDQFDVNRRTTMGGRGEPVMTVTSAMAPAEMSNPSDDYIWQIMFAGENEVPKRVTAHLHHPADPAAPLAPDAGLAGLLDGIEEPGDLLDDIGWMDPATGAPPTNGGGSMQPPPARAVPPHDAVPPPPLEALNAAAGAGAPQTITVTYVVQPGGATGQPQYAVKSVVPAAGSPPGAEAPAAAAAAQHQ